VPLVGDRGLDETMRCVTADLIVRDAVPSDARACAAVYEGYVTDSAISFETDPPTVEEMARRIVTSQASHAWIVAEAAGDVVGYACATRHRERVAYRFACDVSVYLDPAWVGHGIGRRLYVALLSRLAAAGYRMACAGIALPNPASEALHRSLGFTDVGTYRRIGWKHGRWHDVLWLQLPLGGGGDPGVERIEPSP